MLSSPANYVTRHDLRLLRDAPDTLGWKTAHIGICTSAQSSQKSSKMPSPREHKRRPWCELFVHETASQTTLSIAETELVSPAHNCSYDHEVIIDTSEAARFSDQIRSPFLVPACRTAKNPRVSSPMPAAEPSATGTRTDRDRPIAYQEVEDLHREGDDAVQRQRRSQAATAWTMGRRGGAIDTKHCAGLRQAHNTQAPPNSTLSHPSQWALSAVPAMPAISGEVVVSKRYGERGQGKP